MDVDRQTSTFTRVVCRLAIGLSLLLMVIAAALAAYEHGLPKPQWFEANQTVFVAGSIGTEFVPLPVFEVFPKLFPDRFPAPDYDERTKAYKGGWIAKYGFLERRGADEPTWPTTGRELADLLNKDVRHEAFPVGFSFSRFRPFSPDPSPVTFVGLACAGCHSNRLPDRGPAGKLVYGAGNTRLDLIGFFESFRAALLDKRPKPGVPPEKLVPHSITEGPDLTPDDLEYVLSMASIKQARIDLKLAPMTIFEEAMTALWLQGAQAAVEDTKMRDDLPASSAQLRTPEFNPVGPGRTEPFVTLDHEMFRLPANHNHGYSKIPAVFHENDRTWAQFDGSVMRPRTRSGLAAMTAGGSVDNLSGMGVARNIIAAANYTVDELVGPKWSDIFPAASTPPSTVDSLDPADREIAGLDRIQIKGRAIYREKCASCHGGPDPADPSKWETSNAKFPDYGKIVPTINPFQYERKDWPKDWYVFTDESEWKRQTVDPERVVFRDGVRIPFVLYTYFDRAYPRKITGEYFPLRHPLAGERAYIRNSGGYINAALDSLFTRAPYLHNGSIPTLEQLLNLKDRPMTFLRGVNSYDQHAVGILVPETGAGGEPPAPTENLFWLFDARNAGNLNVGHNYPWTRDQVKQNASREDDLRALLEYLKTL